VDREGRPFVVDVNISPGMTDTSLLPMAAGAAGVSFPDLCARILELALARR
jgi:D-alanine-D-alanine ligase